MFHLYRSGIQYLHEKAIIIIIDITFEITCTHFTYVDFSASRGNIIKEDYMPVKISFGKTVIIFHNDVILYLFHMRSRLHNGENQVC